MSAVSFPLHLCVVNIYQIKLYYQIWLFFPKETGGSASERACTHNQKNNLKSAEKDAICFTALETTCLEKHTLILLLSNSIFFK